ncbi:hypothetical protein [Amycolatopsis mediterranei]|uniref:hypothetical protein n=1 Tax=Amycolatopsis mediterranei TaxID=33910 RepID=UPI001E360605|nr:hypothetical protein [Amycolatopsis mediterranei]
MHAPLPQRRSAFHHRRAIFHDSEDPVRLRKLPTAAAAVGAVTLLSAGVLATAQADAADSSITFPMVRSGVAAGANCLGAAAAKVRVVTHGLNETMTLRATGLPADTGFDLFIIQVPNGPFGVSWYQSDLQSGDDGTASVTVIGRFNVETFAVAPNTAPAPVVHPQDAASNPAFAPIHTFHVGFWFNSPADAVKAGCPGTVTPFNGEHNAGVQAMSTRNFADDNGPLRQLVS